MQTPVVVQDAEHLVEPLRERETARIPDLFRSFADQKNPHAVIVLQPGGDLRETLIAETVNPVVPRNLPLIAVQLRKPVTTGSLVEMALFVRMQFERPEQFALTVEQVESHGPAQ